MPKHVTEVSLFKSLQGTWQLRRQLGDLGAMQGTARFRPFGEKVLHYQEQGKVTLGNGETVFAHRAYFYVYEKGSIAVYFCHPQEYYPSRLLHTLQFCSAPGSQSPRAIGVHKCVNDVYKAQYMFSHPREFWLTYQVMGPNKHYTLASHFSKQRGF